MIDERNPSASHILVLIVIARCLIGIGSTTGLAAETPVLPAEVIQRLSTLDPAHRPEPVHTSEPVAVRRGDPVAPGAAPIAAVPVRQFSDPPVDIEFRRLGIFSEVFIPTGPTTENRALARAAESYAAQSGRSDVQVFESFLIDHPQSAWTTALRLNLGLVLYDEGFFSIAMDHWRSAWEAGRETTNAEAASLADRAVGEYALMNAWIGISTNSSGFPPKLATRLCAV